MSGLDFSKVEGFEWDEGNLGHIEKHKVSDREREEAFLSEPFYYQEDTVHGRKIF